MLTLKILNSDEGCLSHRKKVIVDFNKLRVYIMLKKISLVVSGVFCLLALIATILLFPAHWQINKINSELPNMAQINHVFERVDSMTKTREKLPVDIRYINTAFQESSMGALSFIGVLLTWGDGKTFLIDAGMGNEVAEAFGDTMKLIASAGPITTYGAIEKQMGSKINSIKGIGFTHLHSDHTSGIKAICDGMTQAATIYQTLTQATEHNLHTKAGQDRIAKSGCPKINLGKGLIKPIEGFPGIFALSAGGHTPGSTIFVAKVADMTYYFAGDLTNRMEDIHINRDKGWFYSNLIVPENGVRLEQLRVWLKDIDNRKNNAVLVAHDLGAYEQTGIKPWSNDTPQFLGDLPQHSRPKLAKIPKTHYPVN